MPNLYKARLSATALSAVLLSAAPVSTANAVSVSDALVGYSIIANGNPGNKTVDLSDSEIGALGVNGATSPPSGSVPSAASAGSSDPANGITLDGNIAITNSNGSIVTSNTDIHAANSGPGNPGSQGVDCSGNCLDSLNDSRFNTSSPTASFSTLSNGNGVYTGIPLGTLVADLGNVVNDIWSLSATQAALNINNIGNRTDTFGSGLHVVDVNGSNDELKLNNGYWTIDGQADTTVIFRIESGRFLDISNGRIGVSGGIGLNNVLFIADASSGKESFKFSNAIFNGISFWDFGGLSDTNSAQFSDVRGCGQIVADEVKFSNVSLSNCAFNPTSVTAVPLPAALPLMAGGLAIIGFFGRKRRQQT